MEQFPDYIRIETEEETILLPGGRTAAHRDVGVSLSQRGEDLAVTIEAEKTPVKRVTLRWVRPHPAGGRYFCAAWERAYGELGWETLRPERVMPWYFFCAAEDWVLAWGVKTQPRAMCWWTADGQGISLTLDVRCGDRGVVLQGRRMDAATVVLRRYEGDAHGACSHFCKELCPSPKLPQAPVYGFNNWYYAYGSSTAEEVLENADSLSALTRGLENRPFLVIDDCWQPMRENHEGIGGPWRRGNSRFPDMQGLAEQIRERNARPGVWMRLLENSDPSIPEEWRLARERSTACPPFHLDPSVPQALDFIREDVATVKSWGYELLKHDFSTFDLLGRWGFQMNWELTEGGWSFRDRTKTTAEVILNFYKAVGEAWGDGLILGCNCVSHLCAGIFHMNRTGDDVNDKRWERTRRMGVNTLAFTLHQHNRLFAVDADCAPISKEIPWELSRQWMELLAKSATPFFASYPPALLTEEQRDALRVAFRLASLQEGHALPLDWQDTSCPVRWELNGEEEDFQWFLPQGAEAWSL